MKAFSAARAACNRAPAPPTSPETGELPALRLPRAGAAPEQKSPLPLPPPLPGVSDFTLRPLHERPRERLAFLGAEQLNDDELVSLVFGSGATQRAARTLLDAAGGPPGLLRLGLSVLRAIPGIGPARATQLKAALELGRRALRSEPLSGFLVSRAADVARLLQAELAGAEQESVHVFGLDARHRIRSRHVAALGQVDRVQVGLADIFRPLVREGMAAALVAHNHPSGEPSPSGADERLTVKLVRVGELLGVPLLDHIIVATAGYYSFAERGRIEAILSLPSPLFGAGDEDDRDEKKNDGDENDTEENDDDESDDDGFGYDDEDAAADAAPAPRRPASRLTRTPAGCSARPRARP